MLFGAEVRLYAAGFRGSPRFGFRLGEISSAGDI